MATVAELVKDVADLLGMPPESVSALARALIDAGDLPKSSGRAVAQVSDGHIVKLFAAVLLAPKIREVSEVVNAYLDLPVVGVPASAPDHLKVTAGEFLTNFVRTIFEKPDSDEAKADRDAYREAKITFVLNWPEIEVNAPDYELARFRGGDDRETWRGHLKRDATISGLAFIMLGEKNGRDYVRWTN